MQTTENKTEINPYHKDKRNNNLLKKHMKKRMNLYNTYLPKKNKILMRNSQNQRILTKKIMQIY